MGWLYPVACRYVQLNRLTTFFESYFFPPNPKSSPVPADKTDSNQSVVEMTQCLQKLCKRPPVSYSNLPVT